MSASPLADLPDAMALKAALFSWTIADAVAALVVAFFCMERRCVNTPVWHVTCQAYRCPNLPDQHQPSEHVPDCLSVSAAVHVLAAQAGYFHD